MKLGGPKSPAVHVVWEGDGAWNDLQAPNATLIDCGAAFSMAVLEHGMESGQPSVALRLNLPGPEPIAAIVQTSAVLFVGLARALEARFPELGSALPPGLASMYPRVIDVDHIRPVTPLEEVREALANLVEACLQDPDDESLPDEVSLMGLVDAARTALRNSGGWEPKRRRDEQRAQQPPPANPEHPLAYIADVEKHHTAGHDGPHNENTEV